MKVARGVNHLVKCANKRFNVVGFFCASIGACVCYAAPPAPPILSWPPPGAHVQSNRVDIVWNGGAPQDAFEVHIGTLNTPASVDGWNSGTVNVGQPSAGVTTPALIPQKTYFLFVRFHNEEGWGNWTPPSHHFYVGGELLNDPYLVASVVGQQRDHSIAFNPELNQYLVSYMDIQSGDRPYVNAWRLDNTGTRIGLEIHSTGGVGGAGATSATYNSVVDEFLIAFRDDQAHLFGQRVNAATGVMPSPALPIHDANATFEHRVAYSSVSNVYLEVWRDEAAGGCTAVLGRRLDGATGSPIGSVIPIITNTGGQCVGDPRVCYNSVDDEFYVNYLREGNSMDMWGRRVRASDGALLGAGAVLIAGTAGWEWHPGIAHDNDLNRYLLAYEILGDPVSIRGQFVAADGSLIGSRFDIAGDQYNGGAVGCAWNPAMKEYLVTWISGVTAANYARRISQTGALLGEPFRTNGNVIGPLNLNLDPLPVCNTVNNDYLICWQNSHTDVYVRRYKAHPIPPADIVAPAPITGLTLTRFPSSIVLNWTNPATNDFMGTTVRVKTTGFPTGPTDGTFVVDKGNAPSTTDGHEHTGLIAGTTYYYAVFAHDEALNYATAVLASATIRPGDFDGDTDIDQVDFGHFQGCLSGSAVSYGTGCRNTDLDEDGDVDTSDFNTLLPCLGGANLPPGC